ncbi:MAG TPA: hypothetical protein VFR34_04455 [Paracoccaceae bacterium]|nr:hypothetical protein [Paracoccaceae bacterium]
MAKGAGASGDKSRPTEPGAAREEQDPQAAFEACLAQALAALNGLEALVRRNHDSLDPVQAEDGLQEIDAAVTRLMHAYLVDK